MAKRQPAPVAQAPPSNGGAPEAGIPYAAREILAMAEAARQFAQTDQEQETVFKAMVQAVLGPMNWD